MVKVAVKSFAVIEGTLHDGVPRIAHGSAHTHTLFFDG
jgi:hypothetical protein